jgi:hypothetical protein
MNHHIPLRNVSIVLARADYVVNLMLIVQSIMHRLYSDFLGQAVLLLKVQHLEH